MSLSVFTLGLLLIVSSFSGSRLIFPFQDFKEGSLNQVAEKVYLHIDREKYSSADDIWFKAYVIDPSTNRLSHNTNNLHVELISPDGRVSLSRIIRIQDGTGYGDLSLDDSTLSGRYRIRAYTNHMRSYGEEFFFLREITIINPYDNANDLKPAGQKIESRIDLKLFPEGGSLVEDVTSKVAFKATDALGKGCYIEVKLYSESGYLLTTFNSKHLGMGFFYIRPVPGFNYYVVAKSRDGSEKRDSLPMIFSKGVVIRASATSDRNLLLTISTNEATLQQLSGLNLSVNLSIRNLVNTATFIKVNQLVNNYSIPLEYFPDGVLRITLSMPDGLQLCERLLFIEKQTNAALTISTDKTEYKFREKVIAKISLSGDSSFSGAGQFSFSAADEKYTDNSSAYPRSIASWFLLESDVHGSVENPSYYFDHNNKSRLQDLDLLLLTQGWRDFRWKYSSINSFDNETGFTISGTLRRNLNKPPIEGANISLGLFSGNSKEFLNARTDKNGLFRFENLDINGTAEAYLSSSANGRISVNRYSYEPPEILAINPERYLLEQSDSCYSSVKQEVIVKLNNLKKYRLSDTLKLGEVFVTSKRKETPQEVRVRESRKIYSVPDKEVIVTPAQENYSGDVFSFLSGRLGGVRIVRGVNPCSVYFPDDAEVYIREQFIIETYRCNKKEIKIRRGALILLDGYEINPDNLISILTLPMNIVDRVDVLNSSPLYGMRGANGVVNIITKTGIRRDEEKRSANDVISEIKGYDIPRIFYCPDYDNQTDQKFVPDFRSTIFWKPDVKIEKNKSLKLEFFNSDNTATINIKMEGITDEGIPVSGSLKYNVK